MYLAHRLQHILQKKTMENIAVSVLNGSRLADLNQPHDANVWPDPGPREAPDWGPAIRAERDPRRIRVLQDIAEFDTLTDSRIDNGCTLYRLASTDRSLLSRKDAITYIANLLEKVEIWQHLARRLLLPSYTASREPKIHTERRNLGE